MPRSPGSWLIAVGDDLVLPWPLTTVLTVPKASMTPLARASGALTLAWFAAVIIAAVIGQNAALGAFYRVVAIVFVLGMWAEIILGMRRRTLDPELISWSRIMGYLFVLPVNVGAALSPLPWAVWVWAGLLGVMCVVPLKRITRKRGGPVVDPPVRRLPRTRSRGRVERAVVDLRLPGVVSAEVEYDPDVWVRLPAPGVDRSAWSALQLSEFAASRGVGVDDPEYLMAQEILQAAEQSDLRHTYDFFAWPSAELGPSLVVWVDVVDSAQGQALHGDPDSFLVMADLVREGEQHPTVEWWPLKRMAGALRTSRWQDVGGFLVRAHRVVQPGSDLAPVHVYGSGIFTDGNAGGSPYSLIFDVKVRSSRRKLL